MKRELKRNRKSNIPYSLHDSRVGNISFQNGTLTLQVDSIFEYTEQGENTYTGELVFTKVDIETCDFLIFNRTVEGGAFAGEAMNLLDYAKEYPNAEFEILTEGYGGYWTTYTGWLWQAEKEPVSAILTIWNEGDIVYRAYG